MIRHRNLIPFVVLRSAGMAKKNVDLKKDQNGRFFRNIGKYREFILEGNRKDPEKITRPKFYLGSDENQAKVSNARLELLWGLVVQQWRDGYLNENNLPHEPFWDYATLPMAKAVAKGAMKVSLPRNPNLYDDEDLNYRWISNLAERYRSVIEIVPDFEELYQEGRRREIKRLKWVSEETREIKSRLNPEDSKSNGTLHGAFDAYVAHIKKTCSQDDVRGDAHMSAWGNTQIKNVGRLKEHHPDQTLSTLTLDVLEEMELHWAKRPLKKGTNKPIAIQTADSHIKQLRAFFDWLHRNPKFKWRKPDDYGDVRHRPKMHPQEISQLLTSAQVETYTVKELAILYEYANPLEACLLLLGLNCGFGAAEIASLVKSEVFFHQEHPHSELINYNPKPTDSFIRRIRQKSHVYGEFKLWEETVKALKWQFGKRKKQAESFGSDSLIFITDNRQPYVKQTPAGNHSGRIPNIWAGLHRRIAKDHPDFRSLSFGKLRKTAGNLVKHVADGEISGVFLCHGNPVKSDTLQDVYTNRPFGKVFVALDEVEQQLQPIFQKNPNVFSEKSNRLAISKKQNDSIMELHEQGLSVTEIATKVGVSIMTVYRRIN